MLINTGICSQVARDEHGVPRLRSARFAAFAPLPMTLSQNTVILNEAARNEPCSEESRGMSETCPIAAEKLSRKTHGILRLRVAPAFAHGDTPLRMTAILMVHPEPTITPACLPPANEPLPNTVILNGAARNEPRSEEPRGISQRRPLLAEDRFGMHGILRLRVAPPSPTATLRSE